MDEAQFGIRWKDTYMLGDIKVDEQHRQLFKLLNDLAHSCAIGTDDKKLSEALSFLVDYTVQHFYDEESLQVRYNFPDYKRHKQLHEDFKVTVGEIVGRFQSNGSSEELSRDVTKILVKWLISHITKEDKKVGDHLRKYREANILM